MLELTDENFEREIQTADKIVLVDFFASWCPPCSILSPILEKLEKNYEGKVIFAKVNVDIAPITSQKFGISPIPTVILFKEGKPVSGFVGARTEAEIRKWLEENLKNDSEKIEKLIKEYKKYASENGFRLNPNREVVERVIKGLLEREKKFGKRYCPCRQISGNEEKDAKKTCPCFWHRLEIERNDHCLCGLFVK